MKWVKSLAAQRTIDKRGRAKNPVVIDRAFVEKIERYMVERDVDLAVIATKAKVSRNTLYHAMARVLDRGETRIGGALRRRLERLLTERST